MIWTCTSSWKGAAAALNLCVQTVVFGESWWSVHPDPDVSGWSSAGIDIYTGDNVVAFVRICMFLCWLLKNVLMVSLKRAVWIFNVVLSLQPVAPGKCLFRCPYRIVIAAVTSKVLQVWSNDFSRLFWDPSCSVERPLWLHEFRMFKPWVLRIYTL